MTDESASSIYAALFENQLNEESERRKSIESRGLALISTSAALVSLLLALGALVSKATFFELSPDASRFLIGSCVLFVVSTILGLCTNWPLAYRQLSIDDLEGLLEDEAWKESPAEALRLIAGARAGVLRRSRKLNGQKARLLLAGLFVEVAAVASLAGSVILILAKR